MSDTFECYQNQNYEKLKRDLLTKGRLFEDPLFAASDKSISYSRQVESGTIVWKRPYELMLGKRSSGDPHFIKYYPNTNNLESGNGHRRPTYFIQVLTTIVQHQDLFDQIVPFNNQIAKSQIRDYCGLVHFRLWKDGYWYDVCVDDRLPVYADTNKLVFCHNFVYQDEFWASLLEKALAKLNLSYENLDGYCIKDLMSNLTGGIHDSIRIDDYVDKFSLLWDLMIQSRKQKHIMGVSIKSESDKKQLENGLNKGQMYLITRIALVVLHGNPYKLVRLLNFNNNQKSLWNGAWSDNSDEWNLMNDEIREAFEYGNLPKGEFWIDFNGIITNFDNLEICFLESDLLYLANCTREDADQEDVDDKKSVSPINIFSYHGEWKANSTAGGCGQNNEALFWTNPQFLITLNKPSKHDHSRLDTTIVISLSQKKSVEKRALKYEKSYFKLPNDLLDQHIQFRLFKVKSRAHVEQALRTGCRLYASQLEKYADSGLYINRREISKKFNLEFGSYLIVPTCYDANRPGEFLLRIISENTLDDEDDGDESGSGTFKALDKHKDTLLSQDLFFFKKQEPDIGLDLSNRSRNTQHHVTTRSILSPIFERFDKVTWLQEDIDVFNASACNLM